MTRPHRNPLIYLPLTALIIALGIAARIIPKHLPNWYVAYAGDFLWAMLVYFVYAMTLRLSMRQTFCFAIVTSCLIEISQLFHPVWLDYLRSIKLMSFVLGFTFLWSDILAYAFGISLAAYIDFAIHSSSSPLTALNAK